MGGFSVIKDDLIAGFKKYVVGFGNTRRIKMDTFLEQLIVFATNYGLKIIGAILILIIGRIAAGIGWRISLQEL